MATNSAYSLLVLGPLALLCTGAAPAHNWPDFRGPSADGHAEATSLPVHWSETENIRWKTPIHDKGWSSPVIWDDRVWLTTAREDGKQLFAVCVDLKTGKVLMDLKLFDVDKPAFCHPFNSYASSTPAIEKGRLYAHFGSHGTACVSTTTGMVLWERRDLPCNHFRGAGSSPILYGGLLIVPFDGADVQYVVALDKETGKTVWKKDRAIDFPPSKDGDDRKAYGTPAVFEVAGKPQLVCPAAGATIAYEPTTGEELWRVRHGGMNASCRPLLGHNLIFVTCGYKPQLQAIRLGGSGDVTSSHIEWKETRSIPTRPSILLVGDLLFMVSDNGIVSCLDAKTGKQLWQERLGNEFSASPVYADGHLFFADQAGTIYVIEPTRTFKKESSNKLADGCMASPAAVGKSLIIRTKTHLYCIEKP